MLSHYHKTLTYGNLAFKFPRWQSIQASMGLVKQIRSIADQICDPQGIKGSVPNSLVPDSTGHPRMSCVNASRVQGQV